MSHTASRQTCQLPFALHQWRATLSVSIFVVRGVKASKIHDKFWQSMGKIYYSQEGVVQMGGNVQMWVMPPVCLSAFCGLEENKMPSHFEFTI